MRFLAYWVTIIFSDTTLRITKLKFFFNKYASWFDSDHFDFSISVIKPTLQHPIRSEKCWNVLVRKQKKRKASELLKVDYGKLSFAAQHVHVSDKRVASEVVKETSTFQQSSSPTRKSSSTNIRRLFLKKLWLSFSTPI